MFNTDMHINRGNTLHWLCTFFHEAVKSFRTHYSSCIHMIFVCFPPSLGSSQGKGWKQLLDFWTLVAGFGLESAHEKLKKNSENQSAWVMRLAVSAADVLYELQEVQIVKQCWNKYLNPLRKWKRFKAKAPLFLYIL